MVRRVFEDAGNTFTTVLLYRLAFSKTTRYLSFRKKSLSSHVRDERHKLVLLHILLTVGWQSAKWRPPLSLSLISIDLHDTLLSSPSSAPHKSVSEREKSLEHFGRWDWKSTSYLKGSIWGLSHSACCLTWKSLRGLNLNGAFWNYTVALEHLKLMSLCCTTVWVMSPPRHAGALRGSPGGFWGRAGAGGGG